MDLKKLGWSEFFDNAFAQYKDKFIPGRVLSEQKHLYKLITSDGIYFGELLGKMLFGAIEQQDLPAVGDWVATIKRDGGDRLLIHHILPRKSKFSRMNTGDAKEQIVASNIDYVFLVMSLNTNFNLRRMERYLTAAWDSGANPVIILSKADLCEDIDEKMTSVAEIAFGVPIHPISIITGYGIESLYEYMQEGKTIALVGSSGVGKSSLLNYLIGHEVQKVSEVRSDDDRGRHTSTYREMFILPQGGLIVDTPGMREFGLWNGDISETFEDIDALVKKCRFSDCRHISEPGCAIKEALSNGTLSCERYESYKKLQIELKHANKKALDLTRTIEKQKHRREIKKERQRNFDIYNE